MKRIVVPLDRIKYHRVTLPESTAMVLPEGERQLDNFDLCKRTLPRYRSDWELPYQMLYHKTYYKEKEVRDFINRNFDKFRNVHKRLKVTW